MAEPLTDVVSHGNVVFDTPYLTTRCIGFSGVNSGEPKDTVVSIRLAEKADGASVFTTRVSVTVPAGSDGNWRVCVSPFYPQREHIVNVKVRTVHRGKPVTMTSIVTWIPSSDAMPDTPVYVAPPEEPEWDPSDAAPTGDPTHYGFITLDDAGQPYHWNRCQPVKYRITGATPDYERTVKAAFDELGRVSGITFTYDGESAFTPSFGSNGSPSDTEGSITVAFHNGATSGMSAEALGYGGFLVNTTVHRIVKGGVIINTALVPTPGFGERSVGRIILHELGHTMNLAHVDDPSQIMNVHTVYAGPAAYQTGDIAGFNGLASLCATRVSPSSRCSRGSSPYAGTCDGSTGQRDTVLAARMLESMSADREDRGRSCSHYRYPECSDSPL